MLMNSTVNIEIIEREESYRFKLESGLLVENNPSEMEEQKILDKMITNNYLSQFEE